MPKSKILILDSIRSLQNVGAMFRNADGADFEKLYMCGFTPFPPRNDISKTALWAEKTIEWEYIKNIETLLVQLKDEGYIIHAVELSDISKDYKHFQNSQDEKIALILWNEVDGISESTLSLCDHIVSIPMLWDKESLNVSVAAGIVMYSFVT